MNLLFKKHLEENTFLCSSEHNSFLISIKDTPINTILIKKMIADSKYLFNFSTDSGRNTSQGQIIALKDQNKQVISFPCTWKELSDLDVFELNLKYL